MIIECPHCESRVDAEEKGDHQIHDEDSGFYGKVMLLECKACANPLFGISELSQDERSGDYDWDSAIRLWPNPEDDISWDIPEIARNSLSEAQLCFKAKAYAACVVMCGRAIEGVCVHHDPGIRNLAEGLRKLKDAGIIDSRILEWGEALRRHRNLGAHATVKQVSRDDARDVLDFAIAICDYVFVLNEKWERFQRRQKDL